MDFLQRMLRGMSLIPAVVHSIESLFGEHCGAQKKESAMAFVMASMQLPAYSGKTDRSGSGLSETFARREIVDEARFKEGLSRMIDGAVECLNASCWASVRR